MISKHSYEFCKEDVSLIENYDKAMNDTTQIWDCHHRLEIELNMSRAELVKANLYVKRPASELIFLTHSEHQRIHKLHFCPFKNKHHIKETKQLISISSSNRNWLNNGIIRAFVKPEENEYYFERGYHLGFKL